ncbi:structural protein [Xenorhabdus sp. DI]|uniref:structural protein n=1 Tax=Xenorhabdus doucetiae TaxID=351671 RepID=UPI0019CD0F57|nr:MULTISPECIES: structural protein [unclassified Xenorhabdus]MBD2786307.1 structural protein [Xenorhabdus sp. 3]MBD2789833.1 structural protein [Xenorhabdus sp. DI]
MTRGIRNNNPGNIRHGDKWQGLCSRQTDKSFCQFQAPEYGIRAMVKILYTYQHKYGDKTIHQFISRWAPPNENDTEAYINYVSRTVGVSSEAVIDVFHQEIMTELVKAMIRMENGKQPYSDDVFTKAYVLL